MSDVREVLGPLWIVAKKVGRFNLDQRGSLQDWRYFSGREMGHRVTTWIWFKPGDPPQ
jgi:hypothetical protein